MSKPNTSFQDFNDRTGRVIQYPEFEESLKRDGLELADFQWNWDKYDSFEELPAEFQRAILAGERAFNEKVESH